MFQLENLGQPGPGFSSACWSHQDVHHQVGAVLVLVRQQIFLSESTPADTDEADLPLIKFEVVGWYNSSILKCKIL